MDLVTFLTALYVYVDDWYKANGEGQFKRAVGAPPRMSDSAVLTVMIAGQWQIGVSTHEAGLFPTLLKRSAFNERGPNLWGMSIALPYRLIPGQAF